MIAPPLDRRLKVLLVNPGPEPAPGDRNLPMGYAIAAARALLSHTQLSARQIAEDAMKVAADICVFTNHNLTIEEL